MSVALIACNPQYDYLPGGSIDAFGSVQVITKLAQLAAESDLFIIVRDWHPEEHFTFSDNPQFADGSWPPHCVQGTKGAKIFPALRKQADYIVSKGLNRNPPDDYSGFTGKTLRPVESLGEILLQHEPDTIIVGGFLLEIEVKYTALDANAIGGWKVIVPLDATGTLQLSDPIPALAQAGIQVA